MNNFAQMMQKAQKFKQKMSELQDRARETEVSGAAGRGLVTCKMNGKHTLTALAIDKSLIDPVQSETLEDLVMAAVNDASANVETRMKEETEKLMRELGLPPNMDLSF
jgi:DNA-binding YbaB/EbfC family protein